MNERHKNAPFHLLVAALALFAFGGCEGEGENESGEIVNEQPTPCEHTSAEEAVSGDVELFFANLGHSDLETISSFHPDYVNQYDAARFADWVVEAVDLDSTSLAGDVVIEDDGPERSARVRITFRDTGGEVETGELVLALDGDRWKLTEPPFGWER